MINGIFREVLRKSRVEVFLVYMKYKCMINWKIGEREMIEGEFWFIIIKVEWVDIE